MDLEKKLMKLFVALRNLEEQGKVLNKKKGKRDCVNHEKIYLIENFSYFIIFQIANILFEEKQDFIPCASIRSVVFQIREGDEGMYISERTLKKFLSFIKDFLDLVYYD